MLYGNEDLGKQIDRSLLLDIACGHKKVEQKDSEGIFLLKIGDKEFRYINRDNRTFDLVRLVANVCEQDFAVAV